MQVGGFPLALGVVESNVEHVYQQLLVLTVAEALRPHQ